MKIQELRLQIRKTTLRFSSLLFSGYFSNSSRLHCAEILQKSNALSSVRTIDRQALQTRGYRHSPLRENTKDGRKLLFLLSLQREHGEEVISQIWFFNLVLRCLSCTFHPGIALSQLLVLVPVPASRPLSCPQQAAAQLQVQDSHLTVSDCKNLRVLNFKSCTLI